MPNALKIQDRKILIAHDDGVLRNKLTSMLEEIGYSIIATVSSSRDLKSEAIENSPDLIVTGMKYKGIGVIDTLVEIAKANPIPAVIIAKKLDTTDIEKAMEDHVMGYLIDPVSKQDLESTCYLVLRRFDQFQELRIENIELKETLAARKRMERAKGLIMKKFQLSEEDAYLRIRKAATKRRIKMTEVVDIILGDVETH